MPDQPISLTEAEQRRLTLEALAAKATARLEELRLAAEGILFRAGDRGEGISTRVHPEPQPLTIQATLDLSKLRPDALTRVAEAFGQVVAEVQDVQAQLQRLQGELEEARVSARFQVEVRFPDPV